MAFRVLAGALGGAAFGGASYFSRVQAHAPVLGDGLPDNQLDYHHPSDDVTLDVQHEQHQALLMQHKLISQHSDQHAGGPGLTAKFKPFKLGEIINLTEETAIFRFLFDDPDQEFHLVPCSTLQARKLGGPNRVEHLDRKYTPITPNGTKGYFDLIVKKQPHGRFTEHLWQMMPGDTIDFRILQHKLRYLPNVYDNVGMIGTGSGISALLQVIRASLADPNDRTKLTLLTANPTDRRVLLKGTLDELSKDSNGRFKTYYTVDKVVDNSREPWQGFVGLIDANLIKKTMPPPAHKNIILVCGSEMLLNTLCGVPLAVMKPWTSGQNSQPTHFAGPGNLSSELNGALAECGYTSSNVYRF